jgi:methionine-rich copper-binding protein CopC
MRPFHLAPFVALATVAALAAGPAAAHARLVSATPAPDSTVTAPHTLSLTFSERLVPAFSGFDLVDAAGTGIDTHPSMAEDGVTLGTTLAHPLAAGTYRVNWHIASTDGHRMTGTYRFTVR